MIKLSAAFINVFSECDRAGQKYADPVTFCGLRQLRRAQAAGGHNEVETAHLFQPQSIWADDVRGIRKQSRHSLLTPLPELGIPAAVRGQQRFQKADEAGGLPAFGESGQMRNIRRVIADFQAAGLLDLYIPPQKREGVFLHVGKGILAAHPGMCSGNGFRPLSMGKLICDIRDQIVLQQKDLIGIFQILPGAADHEDRRNPQFLQL